MAATQIGAWALDGTDATTEPAWGRTLAPTSVGWVDDRAGNPGLAASFNGTSSQAVTTGPAARTDQSFTITCWIKLATNSKSLAAFGQDATHASGFAGGYEPGPNRLAFVMYNNNTNPAPGVQVAWSTSAPPIGDRVHMAGVHDATTGQIRLNVNGALTQTTAFHATGPFVLGRFRYNDTAAHYFQSSIDDVHLYAGALPDTEIAKLYQP